VSPELQVVLIAAASSGGVGLLGALLLRVSKRGSLRWTLLLLGVVAVAAMVAGVVATARAMFLSQHDLGVVEVVCGVTAAVTLGTCWLVSRWISAASAALGRAVRSLDVEHGQYQAAPNSLGAELDAVSRALAETSERLAASRERERTLEASRRELVAWVSHDLRTPLAGLRAMSEALEDGLVDDPGRYHRQLRVEVDRLAGMVDDLFELSRIQSGALRLSLTEVAVDDLISDALAGAEPLASNRGVRLTGASGAPLLIAADAGEMSRVLANLLFNAIRHTPADGSVRVVATADRPSGDVVVTVADECGGIPDADLPRVFEPAWRGTHARTPGPNGGAGLGLAIVRGIVEAHRGAVRVANIAGGCEFELRLPALHAQA
jgi:signal transduction histidine kinase